MVRITEYSGESNDNDANQNPQQKELAQLPEALLISIFARVRRWNYQKLSFVCHNFQRILTSEMLYKERLLRNKTETFLYALIGFPPYQLPSWCTLNKTNGSFILSVIKNLVNMPYGSALVTIGTSMYVIGGRVGLESKSDVLQIDCRTHESRLLPSMKRARYRPAAGVIDGNIYVIGGCKSREWDWAEVFDVKTETWSRVPGDPYSDATSSFESEFVTCAVMKDKIYVLDPLCCFTYEPKKERWETLPDYVGDYDGKTYYGPLRRLWQQSSCVFDDVLFTIHPPCFHGHPILSFDPKDMLWRPVRCHGRLRLPKLFYYDAKMANFGGKLVILAGTHSHLSCDFYERKEIWCIVIALERRDDGRYDGEFKGEIVSIKRVLTSVAAPYIEHCQAITL